MKEDIVYKLKALQSIEADGEWKEGNKKRMMGNLPDFAGKNNTFVNSNDFFTVGRKFDLKGILASHLVVSLTSLMVVLTSGVITVGASQSSLPGEVLYPVKKASEQVALAVASEEDKPKVEIEQAGKRLEELAAVTQKTSDVEQHKKVEQLVNEFEDKVSSANQRLNDLKNKGESDADIKKKVAGIAEVVNEQSEKYGEVLEKTTESMPESVKDKVAVSVESAVKTAEKTNMEALLVLVESKKDEGDVESEKDRVEKKLTKAEVRLELVKEEVLAETVCSLEEETVEGEEGNVEESEQIQDEVLEEGDNEEETGELELTLQENEESSCVSSDEFEIRKGLILDTQEDITEVKAKIEEKDLVEALKLLALISGEIDSFEKGEFIEEVQEEETQEEVEQNEEEEAVEGESGSVEGVSTEKEDETEEVSEGESADNEEEENIEEEENGSEELSEAVDSEKEEETE